MVFKQGLVPLVTGKAIYSVSPGRWRVFQREMPLSRIPEGDASVARVTCIFSNTFKEESLE